ncbi:hypothetical protein Q4489_04275 [Thalassotalea sp. 1_MG-2023]|uniref:hypothetical protein n=1 Tax=Thalassotalea sp. 1_MG-2023 TaxID=3062680 RepID=UPI0026E3575D|nr:hypothetical protein [Thalassotalea sp. 1_MG-2023]MDO6426213.1 hypothetical protein [Thalassotalea sp. 1_MG-2023]
MKPFTNDTHGRNHHYYAPKEHKVPKSSKDRRGTRSSKRQENQQVIQQEMTTEK